MGRRRLALIALIVLVVGFGAIMLVRNHSPGQEPAPTGGARGSTCPIGTLPREVEDTVQRIHTGGPFPFPHSDGAVFANREGHLPKQRRGYYHEYTVITSRARDRSVRRIVTGGTPLSDPVQYFYTGDHYDSFCLVTDAGRQR